MTAAQREWRCAAGLAWRQFQRTDSASGTVVLTNLADAPLLVGDTVRAFQNAGQWQELPGARAWSQ
ncbi:MAG: hypothetical protein WBN75_01770 [Verrucomicrobiia bacterium]|jgi:hypothetical protein